MQTSGNYANFKCSLFVMKRLVFLIISINHFLLLGAQNYFYTHYKTFGEKDGYQVYLGSLITQDKKGLLWLGSDNGLFSFDGIHFKNYRHSNSDSSCLPANNVLFNYQDNEGKYWVYVIGHGLYNFDPKTGKFIRLRYSNQKEFNIHDERISLPVETKNGSLWFPLPNYGLAEWSRRENKMIAYKICPAYSCGEYYNASWITCLIEDPDDGTLWGGTNDGLVHFYPSDGHFEVYRDKAIPGNKKIRVNVYNHLFFDIQKQLWVGSWGCGIKKFNRLTKGFEAYRWHPVYSGTVNICSGIGQMDDKHLWVGAMDKGLLLFNTLTHTFMPVRGNGNNTDSLISTHLWQNNKGVIWLSDRDRLIRINPRENNFTFYSLEELFKQKSTAVSVNCFIRQGQMLYTGVQYDGFFAGYNLETHQYKKYYIPGNNSVYCLAEDGNKNIWVGGHEGLYLFNPLTERFAQAPGLSLAPFSTYCILPDSNGSMWLATNRGLIHYDPKQKKVKWLRADSTSKPQLQQNQIYTLFKDSKGNIWFGSYKAGIACYRPSTGTITYFNQSRKKTYPQSNCESITEAKDGSILFTSELDGLGILKDAFTEAESINLLNSSNGLPTDNISGVFKDKKDNIWLFTYHGLCWFDPQTLRTRVFTKEDGLAETVMTNIPYQDKEGNMYIGLAKSFQMFDPQKLLTSLNTTGTIHFTSLQVNGKEWPVNPDYISSLQLNPEQNQVAFDFAVLTPELTNRFQYAYKLDGLDKSWNFTGTKTFGQYNSLVPGKYTLRITAMNLNGEWSKKAFTLPVIIHPPWYGTWWFYLLVIISGAAIVYAFFHYRINQVRHESRLTADFTRKLHETEMRALRAQMNPYFIFNCLNSINRYIVKSDNRTASGYLTKFAKLIRFILDNSASDAITLDKEIQTLQLYIEMEVLRFQHAFEYSIEVDENVQPEMISIPSMLIQPYVENAIWHGLLHKETADGKLFIRFYQLHSNLLLVEVEDNGIGRDKAKELKSKEVIKKKSYGMQISKDRISLINELYQMNATVQVEDLTNGREVSGTKVTIQIPVKNFALDGEKQMV
jgi:ligand-binding sensor domain-containing protein